MKQNQSILTSGKFKGAKQYGLLNSGRGQMNTAKNFNELSLNRKSRLIAEKETISLPKVERLKSNKGFNSSTINTRKVNSKQRQIH